MADRRHSGVSIIDMLLSHVAPPTCHRLAANEPQPSPTHPDATTVACRNRSGAITGHQERQGCSRESLPPPPRSGDASLPRGVDTSRTSFDAPSRRRTSCVEAAGPPQIVERRLRGRGWGRSPQRSRAGERASPRRGTTRHRGAASPFAVRPRCHPPLGAPRAKHDADSILTHHRDTTPFEAPSADSEAGSGGAAPTIRGGAGGSPPEGDNPSPRSGVATSRVGHRGATPPSDFLAAHATLTRCPRPSRRLVTPPTDVHTASTNQSIQSRSESGPARTIKDNQPRTRLSR